MSPNLCELAGDRILHASVLPVRLDQISLQSLQRYAYR